MVLISDDLICGDKIVAGEKNCSGNYQANFLESSSEGITRPLTRIQCPGRVALGRGSDGQAYHLSNIRAEVMTQKPPGIGLRNRLRDVEKREYYLEQKYVDSILVGFFIQK